MFIKDKNILITGSAVRIGRAIALSLADAGANIAVHYNSSKKEAKILAEELKNKGVRVSLVRADIKKSKEIALAVETAAKELGGLDVLINNAAIFYPTPISAVKDEDWDNFFSVNLRSQFYFARAFAEKKGTGSIRKIINFADSSAISPAANFIPYGVSKAAVIALTKGLAKAYAPDILVNALCPGPTLLQEEGDERSFERAVAKTALKNKGTIEDIVRTVQFLLDDDYITGQEIFVDGGRWI